MTLKGREGKEKIDSIMSKLRSNMLSKIGDFNVDAIRDYQTSERIEIHNGIKEKIELPMSNVLYYELVDNAWVCVRPSGTEPKIKFYMGVVDNNLNDAEIKLGKLKKSVLEIVE